MQIDWSFAINFNERLSGTNSKCNLCVCCVKAKIFVSDDKVRMSLCLKLAKSCALSVCNIIFAVAGKHQQIKTRMLNLVNGNFKGNLLWK